MTRRIGILALLTLGAMLPAWPAAAQTYEAKTAHGFTMRLPVGWVRIPDDVLQDASAKARELLPMLPERVYVCGFQGQAGPPWVAAPCVLVQVAHTGRIPEPELRNLGAADPAVARNLRDRLKPLAAGVDLAGMVYEPEGHILWKTAVVSAAEGGRGKMLMGMRLTEDGAIGILCLAREKDFDAYRATFEAIVRDAQIDSRLAYRSTLADTYPWLAYVGWGKPWGYALLSAAIALVSGLLAVILASRQKKAASRSGGRH